MADTAVDVTSLQEPGSGWSTMPCELDDGPAARAAIGLIVLANDQVIEPELNTFLPKDGVALYSSRIPLGIEGTLQALRAMEAHIAGAAGRIMPDDRLDVMAFGCTSGSMAIGDDNVAARIQEARPGMPCTNPITAGLAGLKAVSANRIALLTPYTDDINEVVESFISGRGVDIAVKGAFKQRGDPNITRVPPKAIYDAALELGQADVEGVFISCTALRVSSVLEPLEQALGKPVVSSNQAMAWHCLRLAGYDDPVSGYGRLLTI